MTDYTDSYYDSDFAVPGQEDGGDYGGDYGDSSPDLYDDFDMYEGADYWPQDQWSSAMGGEADSGAYASGNTVYQGFGGSNAQWAPDGDARGGGLGGYSANVFAPKPGKAGATGAKSTTGAGKAARKVVQISRQEFTGTAPTLELPIYDEREIKRMTQEELSPAVRELRAGMRRAMLQTYENPNVRGSVLAKALEGYGIGVGRAMAGARASATQRYQQQYGISRENAMAKFQAALDAYKRTARTIQFQQPYETEAELAKATEKNYGLVSA